jgi:Mrp family chromosome partitioning ATPase
LRKLATLPEAVAANAVRAVSEQGRKLASRLALGRVQFATKAAKAAGGIGISSFYESLAFDALRALWRARLLIASFVAAGLVLATLAVFLMPKSYTTEAVVRLDFGREDPVKAKAPPTATMDAAVLVETEARLIRSQAMARRVVTRLRLDEDPAFTRQGLMTRLIGALTPPAPGAPMTSAADAAVRALSKMLAVTNDTRSYAINIAITSSSPQQSARLANAFAIEYASDRIGQRLREAEAGARSALADALATYGEKHPTVIQARDNLAAAEARIQEQDRSNAQRPSELIPPPGLLLIDAEPIWIPAAPNPVAVIAMGLLGSLAAGIALVLLFERRDTGFRTELGVPAETGVRCVGMIPSMVDQAGHDRRMEQREAFRSLCLATGLVGSAAASRVVMVSSALPGPSSLEFMRGLAYSLAEDGQRVLVIDAAPGGQVDVGMSLDDVLGSAEATRQFLTEKVEQSVSELRRASGLNGAHNAFASFARVGRDFEKLLIEAKGYYDVIIVGAPAAVLFAEAVFLGRFADLSLHVATWNETPRATVAEAIRRLRDHAVRVDGIVLTNVDLGQYPSYAAWDRTYYLSKHREAFAPRNQ